MQSLVKNILWVDCIGAIATGILLIMLNGWIAPLFGLPTWFVVGHAFVHLAYGSYSFSLAVRNMRSIKLIKLLVFANAAWAIFCMIFAVSMIGNATYFAVGHFLLEGIYVGGLAVIEWRWRDELIQGSQPI